MQAGPEPLWGNAKWIWIPEPAAGYARNQFMHARRVFTLPARPAAAVLHISADSLYRLTVNGERIGAGPPLADTRHILLDTRDIASVLKPGRNVIAVTVHSLITEIGGLLCRLEADFGRGMETCLVTDAAWRVTQATEWHPDTPPVSNFLGFSEVLDNRIAPPDLDAPDFDDRSWQQPLVLEPCAHQPTLKGLYPTPEAPGVPETVTRRKIEPSGLPALRVTAQRPAHIAGLGQILETEHEYVPQAGRPFDVAWKMLGEFVHPLRTCSIENAEGLTRTGGASMTVTNPVLTRTEYQKWYETHDEMPQVHCATLILDFGTEIAARLRIDVDANEGAILDVAWGEMVLDGRVHPKPHPSWGVTKAGRFTLREGRQVVEMFDWQIYRYVQITFRCLTRPAKVHAITARQVTHPFDYDRYTFVCDDSDLQLAWTAWVDTAQATVIDHLTDYREKGFWTIQHTPSALLTLFGDTPFLRRYAEFCLRERGSHGLLECSPLNGLLREKPGTILCSSFGIAELGVDYFWYGNDTAFFEDRLYPWIRTLLDVFGSRTTERGLFDALTLHCSRGETVWMFVDWTRQDVTSNCTTNESLWWNLKWYLLLREMAPISRELGNEAEAAEYEERAARLHALMHDRFWNEERGLYADELLDGRPSDEFSDYTNGLALQAGLGANGRAARIVANLRQPPDDLIRGEHLIFVHVLLGLCCAGEHGFALDLLKDRLSRFFRTGHYLMGEEWSYFGSMRYGDYFAGRIRNVAQGLETLYLPQLFHRQILGIRPTRPGFQAFRVEPHPAYLTRVAGRIASPRGDVNVDVTREADSLAVEVDVPPDTTAEVVLPGGVCRRIDPGRHRVVG